MRMLIVLLLTGCATDTLLTDSDRALLSTLRYDDSPAPIDPSNHLADDPGARRWGQSLFFDPSLSGPLIEGDNDGGPEALGTMGQPGRVSCAGCHIPASGFVDTRSHRQQVSLGALWTKRRAPTLLESAFVSIYNWDGRRDSIWGQAIGVMESEHEFNSGRLFIAEQIFRNQRAPYQALFGAMPPLDDAARFPQLTPEEAGCREVPVGQFDCRGRPGDGADYDQNVSSEDQIALTRVIVNVAKAIEAYVRQLRCGPSRFDDWLDGDASALDPSEQRGAALFIGRAHCIDCHSGPRLSDQAFHDVGLAPETVAIVIRDDDDHGAMIGIGAAMSDPLNTRGAFSDGDRGVLPAALGPELEGAFRTPSLRCVSSRPSFMHTGQARTLEDVVAFFDRGGDPAGLYPGVSELERLSLSEDDRQDLVAFLRTLDGAGPDPSLLAPLH